MVLIIIGMLVTFCWLFFDGLDFKDIKNIKRWFDWEDFGYSFLFSCLAGAVCVLVVLLTTLIVDATDPKVTHEFAEEREIYAFSDGSAGNRYVCSSRSSDSFVCRYVVEEDGFKHIESVNTRLAYIQEGTDQPCVKTYNTKLRNRFLALFCFEGLLDDRVEFYVPEGTFVMVFEADLQ